MSSRGDCNACAATFIFLPEMVVRGSSLVFSREGHFELTSVPLSLSVRAQMLVTRLGLDHAYSIESGTDSQ